MLPRRFDRLRGEIGDRRRWSKAEEDRRIAPFPDSVLVNESPRAGAPADAVPLLGEHEPRRR
jgi:hypothetical protein